MSKTFNPNTGLIIVAVFSLYFFAEGQVANGVFTLLWCGTIYFLNRIANYLRILVIQSTGQPPEGG